MLDEITEAVNALLYDLDDCNSKHDHFSHAMHCAAAHLCGPSLTYLAVPDPVRGCAVTRTSPLSMLVIVLSPSSVIRTLRTIATGLSVGHAYHSKRHVD